mmetsp:Transcript_2787/g.5907  ORF Transcript_2787/g.5907 Transcript_2787/m.5907 type:complete len:135 (+) Transcript_2787:2448-2852(+)
MCGGRTNKNTSRPLLWDSTQPKVNTNLYMTIHPRNTKPICCIIYFVCGEVGKDILTRIRQVLFRIDSAVLADGWARSGQRAMIMLGLRRAWTFTHRVDLARGEWQVIGMVIVVLVVAFLMARSRSDGRNNGSLK